MYISSFADELFKGQLYAGSHPTWHEENIKQNLRDMSEIGIEVIVSLEGRNLDPIRDQWPGKSMQHYTEMADICLLVADFCPPAVEQLKAAATGIFEALENDKKVFIHCRGGIGRTGTFLAALYMLKTDCTSEEAIRYTRAFYHPSAIETTGQEDSIQQLRTELDLEKRQSLGALT